MVASSARHRRCIGQPHFPKDKLCPFNRSAAARHRRATGTAGRPRSSTASHAPRSAEPSHGSPANRAVSQVAQIVAQIGHRQRQTKPERRLKTLIAKGYSAKPRKAIQLLQHYPGDSRSDRALPQDRPQSRIGWWRSAAARDRRDHRGSAAARILSASSRQLSC